MKWRYKREIPPGYKDKEKFDEGIGDLLIWKTVIEIAKDKEMPVLFVTEDAKSDWWVQSEGAFQPRIELIEEFRRETNGETIHLLPLSELIELFGASEDAVQDTKSTERSSRATKKVRKAPTVISYFEAYRGNPDELRYLLNENLSRLGPEKLASLSKQISSTLRDVRGQKVSLKHLLESEDAHEYSPEEIAELKGVSRSLDMLTLELFNRNREVLSYYENMYGSD